jgi:hypothetical protein
MKARATLALFAVCAASAAAVYLLEIRGGAQRAGRAERARRLVSAEEDMIRRVTVLRPQAPSGADPETLTVERDGEAWRMVSPVAAAGDRDAVRNLVSAIAKAETDRAIDGISDWAAYGLENPQVTIFVVSAEGEPDTLFIGDGNPTGDFVFVRKPGRAEAFLTQASLKSSIGRTVFELRDRTVLPFEKDDVRRVEVRRPGGALVLEKEGGRWEIRKPFEAAAAAGPVDELLNTVKWAEAKAFVDESPRSRSGYGLNAPAIRLTLTVGPDSSRQTLDVGLRRDGRYYAADASRPAVFLVDSGLVSALRKRPDDFREMKIAPFEEWKVRRVEIRSPASGAVAFRKDTSGVWSFDPPGRETADGEKLEDLLSSLSSLEADDFITRNPSGLSRYGLDPAIREVALEDADGELLARIAFGKDRDRGTVFAVNRSTRWVAASSKDIMQHLTPSRTAWTAEKDSAENPEPSGHSGAGGKSNKKP